MQPFRSVPAVLAFLSLLAGVGQATAGQDGGRQGRGGGRGGGSGLSGFRPSRSILRAADVERDEEITQEEWAAFLAELEPGPAGEIDPVRVRALVLVPMLDLDDDGAVTLDDAILVHETLDKNADFVITKEEFPRSAFGSGGTGNRSGTTTRRRATSYMASLPVYAADADGNGTVTEDEWWALVDAVEVGDDGAVGDADLVAWWDHVVVTMEGREGFTQGSFLKWITPGLDADENGVVTVDDLQFHFDRLDTNGDGLMARDELSFSFETFRPSERDLGRSPLMPWQRSLGDALALVETTGKPLLICVNMDGERASDSLALSRYRDPAFVELVRGFVPILASTDQHNARDHDDRGVRILDERFGRLVDGEHIDHESTLYERYFGGNRTAPRHLAIDAEGNVLFDIFLENDLRKVDDALREHGKPEAGEAVDPASLTEEELLASPDAGHRTRLEQLYLEGDERARARLAGLSLSSVRRTQHPEILRMALVDPAASVREQAVWAIVQHPARAPLDFFVAAFRNGAASPGAATALLDGLAQVASSGPDTETRSRARRLHGGYLGLRRESEVVDVRRWEIALSWADPAAETTTGSREKLTARLADLEHKLTGGLSDPELNLAFAAATMSYAQLFIRDGDDPTFLLQDVAAAARRATSDERPDGRAMAFQAWAHYLLNDLDAAATFSGNAVEHLLPWAGTPLAARTLGILMDTRMRTLHTAIDREEEPSPALVADAQAVAHVLLAHPHGTADQALAYLGLLAALEADHAQEFFLALALERFPASGRLHAYRRSAVLRDSGIDALLRVYEDLEVDREFEATVRWYEGLALLVAAERHVEEKNAEAALDAYTNSVERFRSSSGTKAEYEKPGDHYVCLALAGAARLHVDGDRLDEAVAALREGVAASPESVWESDGLGNSPTETAKLLYQSLVEGGRKDEATSLREFLDENGLEIDPRDS